MTTRKLKKKLKSITCIHPQHQCNLQSKIHNNNTNNPYIKTNFAQFLNQTRRHCEWRVLLPHSFLKHSRWVVLVMG